jgi:hypothetical protein
VTRRWAALLALVAVLGLAVAACSGDGDEEAGGTPAATTATDTEPPTPPIGNPKDAVEQFVEAIEASDQNISWGLLSSETKTTFQIDKQHWVEVLMPALKADLKPGGKVVFHKRFGPDHALIVLGDASRDGPFTAALRSEDGGWRLEMFYPEFNPTRPTPGERVATGHQPMSLDIVRRRDKEMTLRIWLDGKERVTTLETDGNFLRTYTAALPVTRGKHLIVAYASTEEKLAGAFAWEFVGR